MDVRILDLDGAVATQKLLAGAAAYTTSETGDRASAWPAVSGNFAALNKTSSDMLGGEADDEPHMTFYGSGDFHHVSLALLRRLREPFNLLVLDNHPDWMRGVPFLHCGTWLRHASLLPMARRIFHVGGEVDFDNSYRWMAPCARAARGPYHDIARVQAIPSRRLGRRRTRTSTFVAVQTCESEPSRGTVAALPRGIGRSAVVHFFRQGRPRGQ